MVSTLTVNLPTVSESGICFTARWAMSRNIVSHNEISRVVAAYAIGTIAPSAIRGVKRHSVEEGKHTAEYAAATVASGAL